MTGTSVFETPEPITIDIDLVIGEVWVTASDRTDTVVEVRPRSESSKSDRRIADLTTVDYASGRLTVRAPKNWLRYSTFSAGPSIDIVIDVPARSDLLVDAHWATFRCEGPLGECRFNTGGAIRLGHAATLDVDTSAGDVIADRVDGDVRVTTGSGKVRIGSVGGVSTLKNSSGECWLGEAGGDVVVNTASGDITIDRALAGVKARTAYGAVRLGEVVRGSIDLQTSYGAIDIGIRNGTAAWLDVGSRNGRVYNALAETPGPRETDETAEIRASNSYGDIMIRRS